MCRLLLCYSDSNTYGHDPQSYLGGRYPKSVRWTGFLNASGLKVINEGGNGRSIPRQDWEIESAAGVVCRSKAERIVVMLGSNDLLQCPGLSIEICGARMEEFLATLLTKVQADLKVLLVAPPPMAKGVWVSDPRTLEAFRQLAKCYETVTHQLGIGFADAGIWGVELTYDGVHFFEKGHLDFAKGIHAALDYFLQESNSTIQ